MRSKKISLFLLTCFLVFLVPLRAKDNLKIRLGFDPSVSSLDYFSLKGYKQYPGPLTTTFTPNPLNLGLEVRILRGLWLGLDYYQNGRLEIEVTEKLYQMDSPTTYFKLLSHQANFSLNAKEFALSVRYCLFNKGRFSFVEAIGASYRRLVKKVSDDYQITFYYPASKFEEFHSTKKMTSGRVFLVIGFIGELRLLSYLSISAEAWVLQPESSEKLGYQSICEPNLIWETKIRSWRTAVSLKLNLF
jgi:hypothetical protein